MFVSSALILVTVVHGGKICLLGLKSDSPLLSLPFLIFSHHYCSYQVLILSQGNTNLCRPWFFRLGLKQNISVKHTVKCMFTKLVAVIYGFCNCILFMSVFLFCFCLFFPPKSSLNIHLNLKLPWIIGLALPNE